VSEDADVQDVDGAQIVCESVMEQVGDEADTGERQAEPSG
jgi:hypothetical protein